VHWEYVPVSALDTAADLTRQQRLFVVVDRKDAVLRLMASVM
jgi:hypothetical protein